MRAFAISLVAAVALAGCATPRSASGEQADAFLTALKDHCGRAYAGRLVSDPAADPDMAGAAMVMHVRDCAPGKVRVPFHVQRPDGTWDRSRTWVLTRTATGLRLKHDHRHEDGSPDALTMYGGDTAVSGDATRQVFPVDAESIALFRAQGRAVSVTNVWTMAIEDGRFTYALDRAAPNVRAFRVAFDLTRPVPAPPPPWGAE